MDRTEKGYFRSLWTLGNRVIKRSTRRCLSRSCLCILSRREVSSLNHHFCLLLSSGSLERGGWFAENEARVLMFSFGCLFAGSSPSIGFIDMRFEQCPGNVDPDISAVIECFNRWWWSSLVEKSIIIAWVFLLTVKVRISLDTTHSRHWLSDLALFANFDYKEDWKRL